jgi:hypothetical protein
MNIEPNEGRELVQNIAQRWMDETDLVPLSVLSLDHLEPVGGWQPLLEARGIEMFEDDLLRPSITREAARRLVQERRRWELENAERTLRRLASFEAQPVPAGVPLWKMPGRTSR